jgi:Na+/H+-dicarboxylate symporter
MFKNKLFLFIGLLLAVLIPAFFGSFLPLIVKSSAYAFSLTFKALLLFILPFIIFSFVFSCLLSFKTGVVKLVFTLIGCIFISNLIAICCGFTVGSIASNIFTISKDLNLVSNIKLEPLWSVNIPLFIKNEYALIAGFLSGMFFSLRRTNFTDHAARKLNYAANYFLSNLFIPFIPFFIFGLICKLEHESILQTAIQTYGPFFIIIITTQISYLLLVYSIAACFNFSKTMRYIKNILPATLTGFSASSSAAALPVLILCSNKNANPKIVETILPATINTHTIGSAIGISILITATIKMFDLNIEFVTLVKFILAYAVSKFAVAGVPGGVIVIIYPLLESVLGFSSEMIGIITAMYLLFDPFGTAMNVTGNGAFAIIFDKIYHKISPSNSFNHLHFKKT